MRFIATFLAACLSLGGPATAGEIVVYTSYEPEDLDPYRAAFQKDVPGVTIRWVHDANGVITDRLMAEKASPLADAVWGVAASSLGQLADAGVLLPYAPPGLARVPPKFRDPADPPRWFGNSAWVAAMVYNKAEGTKLGLPKPETWADLAKPLYRGRVVMPHPRSSGTAFMDVSAWLQAMGEEAGWKFMDALHLNIWRYTHSGSQPASLAARGQAVVGISFDIRAARELEQGAPIEIVFPQAALGWEMNAFAVVKGAPHADDARKLADWAASDAAMRMYAETRAVSARPEFSKPVKNLPADLPKLLMANDFAWAARNRERILAEWARRYDGKADPKK